MSKLNPYAAEYIPLFKMQVDNKTHPTEKGVRHDGAAAGSENLHHIFHDQHLNSHSAVKDPYRGTFSSISRSHCYNSSLHNANPEPSERIVDEEYEIDLEYLQARFPSISYQSLMYAYAVNSGDLEATVDMVIDLENANDSSEILPETLDIDDVPEPEPSANDASLQLKNVAAEDSSSSL